MPKYEYESHSSDAVAMRAAILGGKLRRFERMADLQPGRWINFPVPGAEHAEGRVRGRQSDVGLRGVQ